MTQRHAKVPKLAVVLPPSDDGSSFEIYRAASVATAEITLPEDAREEDFFIDAANYQLPHAVLTRVRSCAQLIHARPGPGAPAAAPSIQVFLYLAGTSEAQCEGRRISLGPGDIVFYDTRRTHETAVTAFDVRMVTVPHDRVPPVFLSPGVHGLRLPAKEAGTRLLASALEGLLREIEGLSAAEADHAVLALFQLAAGPVETHLARHDRNRRRWADPQLDAAMAYIERRCTDVELAPNAVRAYLGISRSALYRLFAPLGGIDAAIRQRRLDHCMRSLLADGSSALPLRKLAQSQGFSGEAQLVRAFRARFGATPSQIHAKIASGDQAWLLAQAGRAGFDTLQAWLAALASGFPDASYGARHGLAAE